MRYTLDTNTGSHRRGRDIACPKCGRKRFVRYWDTEAGQYLPPEYGRCNRQESCGYWRKPERKEPEVITPHEPRNMKYNHIPADIVERSRAEHKLQTCDFRKFLALLFGANTSYEVFDRYRIGTSLHWEGAVCFWYHDRSGLTRSGKVIAYDPITGRKRNGCITWAHALIPGYFADFKLLPRLFGEFLLSDSDTRPIAIVESEKTACIMSVDDPSRLWMACGSKNGLGGESKDSLNLAKLTPLIGRRVELFPDLSKPGTGQTCYQLWGRQAEWMVSELGIQATVSDALERIADDPKFAFMRDRQCDIADRVIFEKIVPKEIVINDEDDPSSPFYMPF